MAPSLRETTVDDAWYSGPAVALRDFLATVTTELRIDVFTPELPDEIGVSSELLRLSDVLFTGDG